MPALVALNDFADPLAISADIGVDPRLLLGPTGDVTPRYQASETVPTHQRAPGITLWERVGESQKCRERKTQRQKEPQRHVERGRGTPWDGEKYSGTDRRTD